MTSFELPMVAWKSNFSIKKLYQAGHKIFLSKLPEQPVIIKIYWKCVRDWWGWKFSCWILCNGTGICVQKLPPYVNGATIMTGTAVGQMSTSLRIQSSNLTYLFTSSVFSSTFNLVLPGTSHNQCKLFAISKSNAFPKVRCMLAELGIKLIYRLIHQIQMKEM